MAGASGGASLARGPSLPLQALASVAPAPGQAGPSSTTSGGAPTDAARISQQLRGASQDSDRLHAALAATDARIESLNATAHQLDQEIAATDGRLASDRQELRGLARAIYIQPDSIMLALAESRNAGDFLTRLGDLAVAGVRAQRLVHSLAADGRSLSRERSGVAKAQADLAALRQTVVADLAALAAAQRQAVALQIPQATGSIPDLIRAAFSPLGSRAVDWALKVAYCESGYNPNAVNPYSGTEGLFQFKPSTWRGTPWGADSPFNAEDNARAAAWLYQREGSSPWQCQG